MPDARLEQALRELRVEWPPTPDIATAIRPRLEPHRSRRPARLVAAVVLLLVGGTMAVEPARSAVLEFLGLKSVRIERREPRATPAPEGRIPGLGRRVTAAEVTRRAGFAAAPPAALGEPDAIHFAAGPPEGGRVSYVYDGPPRLLVMEMRATVTPVIGKSVGQGATIERIDVDGNAGYWLGGRPHGFAYIGPDDEVDFEDQRLAGPTLLVERDGLLLRVEGRVTKQRAVAIARSITATSDGRAGSSD